VWFALLLGPALLITRQRLGLRVHGWRGLPMVSAGGDVLGRELPRFGVNDVIIPVAEESQALDPMIARTLEPQGLRLHLGTADGLLREPSSSN